MAEIIALNDANIDEALNSGKAVMLYFAMEEGQRSDFTTAFRKSATEADGNKYIFGQIGTVNSEATLRRFEITKRTTLVGWGAGEVIFRRSRPWGTDVPLAVERLAEFTPVIELAEGEVAAPPTKPMVIHDKPVKVTDQTFENEVLNSELPVLVDFWAEWCGPCRTIAPILDKLAKEFAGKIKIAKVNVDENPALSQTFRIQSIPNMMAIKKRTMVFNQPGALPEPVLRDIIKQLIELDIPDKPAPQPAR